MNVIYAAKSSPQRLRDSAMVLPGLGFYLIPARGLCCLNSARKRVLPDRPSHQEADASMAIANDQGPEDTDHPRSIVDLEAGAKRDSQPHNSTDDVRIFYRIGQPRPCSPQLTSAGLYSSISLRQTLRRSPNPTPQILVLLPRYLLPVPPPNPPPNLTSTTITR